MAPKRILDTKLALADLLHSLPCLVYGHQLLDPLTLNKEASILQVVSDDLMYGIEDCHYCVFFQVFGRTLLAAGQIADQVPHGIAPYQKRIVRTLKTINHIIQHQWF